MAIPAIPQNLILQTSNGQNYLSWDLSPGATAYEVFRSTDEVNYSSLAAPTYHDYLDDDVTIGQTYWYKVRATNTDGTSPFTTVKSCVTVPTGEYSLGQLRLEAQRRADRENSDFVSKTEWNSYINQSLFELYDLLITMYGEDYFAASPLSFVTDGASSTYPLPDGINYDGAKPFYKLLGVDLAVATTNNGYVTLKRFNFQERNRYIYPNTASTIYGLNNLRYRIMGNNLEFIPQPAANQPIRLWYIPKMRTLLKDSDITDSGVSGWLEYVIVDAAIKALQKEESPVDTLQAQKAALIMRIQGAAANRDAGMPDTVTDSTSNSWGRGYTGGWNDPLGGW